MRQIGALILALGLALPARADSMREFVTLCTYGVLAGTLVGAATLAFTDQPGENLGNIARGASLGLYAGILLGVYVAYAVPSEDEEYDENGDPIEEGTEEGEPQVRLRSLYPMLSKTGGIEGAGLSLQVLTF